VTGAPAAQADAAARAALKAQRRDLANLGALAAAADAGEAASAARQARRAADRAERARCGPPRLGKRRFQPAPVQARPGPRALAWRSPCTDTVTTAWHGADRARHCLCLTQV